MSGISTSVEVVDRVSGALNRITAALYNTTSAFYDVDRASEITFNTAGVQAMMREMYNYEERIQELEADVMDVNSRLEEMQELISDNESATNELEDAFQDVAAAVAAIGIGALISEEVSKAVDYASDLTEVQNVVDTVFGENSAINDWAQNTLNAVGLNELSAKQFAGTMGAMLSSSGVAEEKIESMSMSITELAGDMASFYNLDAEEAFGKIRSGISGETEPLKQLGINMSVANLEAYALANGIEASYSEMDQASQTLLRYHYLMDATSNAQNDFSRTSNSYANQTKLLKENWSAFTGELATNALPVLAFGIGLLNEGVSFISENWSIISPILTGLLVIIGAYTAALVVYNAVKTISAVVEGVHAAASAMATGATFAQTVAQNGLNAALLACPITWIILLIIALIAIIIALCNWIAKTTDMADSGIGVICGALSVAGAFIANLFFTLINAVVDIIAVLWNFIAAFVNFFANVFNDPIGSIARLFFDLVDTVLGLLQTLASAIDTIFGSNLAASVQGWRDSLGGWVDDTFGKGTEVMAKVSGEEWHLDRIEYGDAWENGSEWGDGVASKLGNLTAALDTSSIDSAYTGTDAGSVADSLSSIAGDTSAISDSVDISDENLKYLRDVAERDTINRFTTAEIKVDMQNTNTINSNMDLDGIVDQLTLGVQEAMEQAAEGVHE